MKKDVQLGGSLPAASLPCPACGETISIPIEALLAFKGAVCFGCGARLEVDREASEAAIDALRRLAERLHTARHDVLS